MPGLVLVSAERLNHSRSISLICGDTTTQDKVDEGDTNSVGATVSHKKNAISTFLVTCHASEPINLSLKGLACHRRCAAVPNDLDSQDFGLACQWPSSMVMYVIHGDIGFCTIMRYITIQYIVLIERALWVIK